MTTTKKYLCNAPRPHEYAEKAEALLKSFDGDETKLKAVMVKTVRNIRRVSPQERRTGPGRKSNGEHAMGFYLYVLGVEDIDDEDLQLDEINDEDDENGNDIDDIDDNDEESDDQGNDKDESNDDDANNTSKMETEKGNKNNKSNDDGKILDKSNPVRDDAETEKVAKSVDKSHDSSSETTTKMASATTNHHRSDNDDEADETSDPETETPNSSVKDKKRQRALSQLVDAWGYLPVEGVEGRRTRKQPTLFDPKSDTPDSLWESDSKYTSKLESKKRGMDDDDENDDESLGNSSTDNVSKDGTKSSSVHKDGKSVTIQSEANRSEANLSTNATKSSTNNDQGTNHDPVNPKSESIDRSSDHSCDSQSSLSTTANTTTAKIRIAADRKRTDGAVWCNYCMDDPKIKVCVFCACRVCFGKHDKTKLLLCDGCDDEYHTYCIGLDEVPSTTEWYCPNCRTPAKSSVIGTRRSIPPKKIRDDSEDMDVDGDSRGRVTGKRTRKPSVPWSPDIEAAKQQLAKSPQRLKKESEKLKPTNLLKSEASKSPTIESEKKRGPGRPPKNLSEHQKRGPGRPPSSSSKTTEDRKRKSLSSSTSPPKKRSRGRPPKENTSNETTKRRGPGRPPKSDISTQPQSVPSTSVNQASKPEKVPITVSRSGRTVKRHKYHDEIDDAPQHLHSGRSRNPKNDDDSSDSESVDASIETKQEHPASPASSQENVEKSEPVRHPKPDAVKVDKNENESRTDTESYGGDKDDDMSASEDQHVAPVRMKSIVQPSTPVRAGLPSAGLPTIPENSVAKAMVPNRPGFSDGVSTIIEIRGKKMALPEVHPPIICTHSAGSSMEAVLDSTQHPLKSLDTPDLEADRVSSLPTSDPLVQSTTADSNINEKPMANLKPDEPLLDPVALEAAVMALPDTGPKPAPQKTTCTR